MRVLSVIQPSEMQRRRTITGYVVIPNQPQEYVRKHSLRVLYPLQTRGLGVAVIEG